MPLATVDPGTTTVAVVGLGVMGRPMAHNLLAAGYRMRVHNRSRAAVDELAAAGARSASSPREVAADADVVVTVLPDGPDVEDVVLGDDGLVHGLEAGAVLVDMSTISPLVARRVHAELDGRGVACLDAPVSGGEQGAIDGTLSVMVGGRDEVVAACRPLLDVLGGSVHHVGEAGAGQVAKACNQIVVAQTLQAVAEALTLAARSGVDPARVREALAGGFAGSRILEVHGQRILDRAFDPGFTVDLHRKDLGIALDAGAAAGVPLVSTALVEQLLGSLAAQGLGAADHSSLALLVESLAGADADA